MKNPFYSFLTPLLAIGVTLLGFFLLKPAEPTALYWINMTWLIALEVLFFVWLRWGRLQSRSVDEQTVYFRIFLGVSTLYYIAASIIWMLFFFICGTQTGRTLLCIHFDLPEILDTWPEMSIRIYLVGILAITVLWIVIAAVMGRHDVVYNTQQTELENATEDVRDLVAELKDLAADHATPETQRAWNALIRDAESVPPRQLASKADSFRSRANKLINQ